MNKYTGQSCTSCRSVFKDGDDIVVCPECGSPYHRECYKNEGRCVNTILHESGESWTPEVVADESKAEASEKVVCSNCGQKNEPGAAFCSNCGVPINSEKAAEAYYKRMNSQTEGETGDDVPPFMGGMPFIRTQTVKNDTDVDGNNVGDYTKYVGSNFFYFIPKFMQFAKGKILSFNFSAFLFPHLYFFYRKMIPEGILMLVIYSILSVPEMLVTLPKMYNITALSLTQTDMYVRIGNFFSIVSWIVSIAAGLFANWLYYRKAKTDIIKCKENIMEENSYSAALKTKGGTSWKYVICAVLAVSILTAAISMVILQVVG